MDVVRKIAKVPTDMYDKPRIPITVFDTNELDNDENCKDDHFQKTV
jgi:hypothetical protein